MITSASPSTVTGRLRALETEADLLREDQAPASLRSLASSKMGCDIISHLHSMQNLNEIRDIDPPDATVTSQSPPDPADSTTASQRADMTADRTDNTVVAKSGAKLGRTGRPAMRTDATVVS